MKMICNKETLEGLAKVAYFTINNERWDIESIVKRPTVRAYVKNDGKLRLVRWENGLGWREADDKTRIYNPILK